jgi:DNA processing protein
MQTTPTNQHYWLAALHLSGVGTLTVQNWLQYFSTIETIFSVSIAELKEAGLTAQQITALREIDWAMVEKDWLWAQQPNRHILTCTDALYPPLLRELPDAPLLLFVEGDLAAFAKPQVAMVGTRHPTYAGKEMAEQFAYSLAKLGLGVVSGLALGVDTESHKGALRAKGSTIAVLGSGLNEVYPYANKKLAEKISQQGGAVVSEFPLTMRPHKQNFPRRNRIISGLSTGVVVVEAAIRSGSLITARFAAEQGREVFAIPGSIYNPLARGCHQLIREGAKLVEKVEDIVEELGTLVTLFSLQPTENTLYSPEKMDPKETEFLALIDYSATALDTIIMRSGLTASEVSSMLLSLELRNYVRIVPGGYAKSPLGN